MCHGRATVDRELVRGRADSIRKAIVDSLSSIGSAILIGRSLKSYVQCRFGSNRRLRYGKTLGSKELIIL